MYVCTCMHVCVCIMSTLVCMCSVVDLAYHVLFLGLFNHCDCVCMLICNK